VLLQRQTATIYQLRIQPVGASGWVTFTPGTTQVFRVGVKLRRSTGAGSKWAVGAAATELYVATASPWAFPSTPSATATPPSPNEVPAPHALKLGSVAISGGTASGNLEFLDFFGSTQGFPGLDAARTHGAPRTALDRWGSQRLWSLARVSYRIEDGTLSRTAELEARPRIFAEEVAGMDARLRRLEEKKP